MNALVCKWKRSLRVRRRTVIVTPARCRVFAAAFRGFCRCSKRFFFVVLVVVASPYFEPCSGTVMQSIKGNAEVLKAFRKRRVFRIMRGGGKGEVDSLCAGWGENEVVKGEGRKLD